MHKFYWALIIVLMINLGCKKKTEITESTQIQSHEQVVKVALAEKKTISDKVKITGEIAPLYRLDIFPKANGIVISESISLGSKVQKDQVLAEVKQDIPGMDFSSVKIKATNNGYITRDGVEIGSRVSLQTPVYEISQLQPLTMVGKIIEAHLDKINIGDTVPVKVDAYPDTQFKGTITEISPVVDRLSRMANIKIKLDNAKLKLKPGMFAQAYLEVGKHQGLVIPLDSIIRSGLNHYVFVIRSGKAKQIKVKTGIIIDEEIEVFGNLNPGDQVVFMGQNLLTDGAPVIISREN